MNVCEIEICVVKTDTFLFFSEELSRNSCVSTASTALDATIDPFAEESDDDMRPIPPSLLQEDIFISDSLPVPARVTPVLPPPPPSKKEKQRRITNQEVLKFQAEVFQIHKEVMKE